MEDAINQLQDLGVTRGQAKRALARYNNDVARAADYIFSGAELSDDDTDDIDVTDNNSAFPGGTETDEEMALRLSLEEQQQHQQQTSTMNNTAPTNAITTPIAYLDKTAKLTANNSNSAGMEWSVVPFTPKKTISDKTTTSFNSLSASSSSSSCSTANTATTSVMGRYNSLTWWSEPEDPNDRKALGNIPAGLRPPSYNAAYAPILIQALFHITAFQQLIYAFRPIPYTYGDTQQSKNYWKGFGEPVPGYVMHEVKTRVPIVKNDATTVIDANDSSWLGAETVNSTPTFTSDQADRLVDDLIDVDNDLDKVEETMKNLSLNDVSNDGIMTSNQGSPAGQSTTVVGFTETITSSTPSNDDDNGDYEEYIENDLQSIPKSVQALAELQKIFAFLGQTKRRYGNVAHFVRALNASAKETTATNHIITSAYNDNQTDWGTSDKSFDAFLEMLINCLLEAGGHSEDSNYEAKLKSLFQLKAKIVYGDEVDTEEVSYLTLHTDEHMNSIHACLDPFVYESFSEQQTSLEQGVNNKEERDPSMSDSEEEEEEQNERYKFTTFTEIPSIFMLVLESKDPKRARFNIEQTIYLDRYLEEKKHISLEGFKQLDTYRKEIQQCRLDLEVLSSSGVNQTLSKANILDSALDYFDLKQEESGINRGQEEEEEEEGKGEEAVLSSADIKFVQSVLSKAKLSIETKMSDLESRIKVQQEKVADIFDNHDELRDYPYRLQASFHHDGMNGTGHYWAYIWVQPSKAVETNLLQDIPLDPSVEEQNLDEHARGGGWFKFCDASVEPVSESDIQSDSTSPFALIYTACDHNPKRLPSFSKDQLFEEFIPNTLKDFIAADNELFEKELYNYNHPSSPAEDRMNSEPSAMSTTESAFASSYLPDSTQNDTPIGEDIPIREKQGSVHYEQVMIEDTANNTYSSTNPFASSIFEDATHLITSSNHNNPFLHHQQQQRLPQHDTRPTEQQNNRHEAQNGPIYSFSGQPFMKLRDRVNNEIIKVLNYPKDDYRLLKSFEVFLARTQHQLSLEHLYLLYSKGREPDNDNTDGGREEDGQEEEEDDDDYYYVDEEAAREDSELKLIWKEYESYLAIASMITEALVSFLKRDFADALQQLLDAKRVEATWKTHFMLDTDFSHAYSGLETISYNDLVNKYGKACLQILNGQAYVKAVDFKQRTAGLQDAIKIAQQAQMVIGPDHIQDDPLYQNFKELWLSFTENQNVMTGPELRPEQVDLLNQLFMIYLEGHSGGVGDWSARSSAAVSRCASPTFDDTDKDKEDSLPIWQKYKEVCTEAEQLLSNL